MNRITKSHTVLALLTIIVFLLGGTLAVTGSPPAMVTPTPTPVGQEPVLVKAPSRLTDPLPPEALEKSLHVRGFIPPPMDLSHLTGQKVSPTGTSIQAVPSSWDWRTQGKVTSVKNQSTCGSCYAFASLGNIESKMLIDSAGTYDFSENNAKECNWYELTGTGGGTSCSGGNYYMMANMFSKKGTVLEADDPYVASDVGCTSPITYQKTLLDWRVISGSSVADTNVLKQYIYDHGPVYTSMYGGDGDAWEIEFGTYDGSYTLYHTGTEPTNHAVLIVGWDDSLSHAGGSGGWIVKNSWGTGWGDNGYFTIAYGSASIGKYSSFMYHWQNYDSNGDLWYYDEGGWSASWGCGTPTAWGLVRFTPSGNTHVTRVEFWTNDQATDVDVYLYDNFDGSNPSGLLAQKLNNSFNEAGYHSVALDSPVAVSNSDDVFAVLKVTNDSYTYPIVADDQGPSVTGRTYLSCSGSSWTDLGSTQNNDVGIRLRTNSTPAPNVGITKQVIGSDFESGDPITFTLTIANSGSEVASNVVVTDIVPSEVLTPTCASTLSITETGSISYVWEVESLSIGESGVITIYGWIDPSLASGSSFENTATISDPGDETSGNNTSSVTVGGSTIYLPVVLKNYPPSAGWATIVSENFEGSFPGSWDVSDDQAGYGEYYWGKRNCRSYEGFYSGWAVGGGANGSALSCGSNYPDNAESWMVYGPFSLVGATAADLSFKLWLNSQMAYDRLCRFASTNGTYFYGSCTSGNTAGWIDRTLDLTNVPTLGDLTGQSNVWVALMFDSSGSTNYSEGAYADNVVLRKYTSGASGQAPPARSSVLPESNDAQINETPAIMIWQK